MSAKMTLEEIEVLAKANCGDVPVGRVPRLLEIAQEQAEALRAAKAAMRDMLCGWKIIRNEGGEEKIYGIGWDRAQSKVEKALDLIE